ncbi:MAG TPA: DegT/DnrJ/EryC1/StrS family aminotransferase [Ktedonobacterales bacterium]
MQTLRKVPLDNLRLQYEELADDINRATLEVWQSGKYVLTQGTQVKTFEAAFAAYIGTSHAMGVSSGTAALHLSLAALGIGSGDEVIVPANTYAATVFAISYTGATPVLVDVDPRTFTMDPTLVRSALTPRTKALLPVHLFGLPADMTRLMDIAHDAGLAVVEDCAQAHGAEWQGKKVGSFGVAGCFSFYPTKNLGAHGDAGIVTTSDGEFARLVRRFRYMGQDVKYRHEVVGFQERMDEVQGAVLSVKLPHLDRWNEQRRYQAQRYNELLAGTPVTTPVEPGGSKHVYYVYTVRAPERDALAEYLTAHGIETGRFYPRAIPEQPAYAHDHHLEQYPVTAAIQRDMLSLPVFPGYSDDDIAYVARHVRAFYEERGS